VAETGAEVRREVVVVGASAGGVHALTELVGGLPLDLPAAVLVVLHVPSTGTSTLPAILSRVGGLPATHAEDGERIEQAHIYVAPPDFHLGLQNGTIRLTRGPRENGHRPAIDTLFRAAALAYGPKVIGVVLSGALDDGALGARAIKAVGGTTIVQSPEDAIYPDMPRSAIALDDPDHVAPVAEIARLLAELAGSAVEYDDSPVTYEEVAVETDYLEPGTDARLDATTPWQPSDYVCPDCGGVLREIEGDRTMRFRCRVGHAFSLGSLLEHQAENIEQALWTSYRALEERASMARRLSERLAARGSGWASRTFAERAREADEQGAMVLKLIQALAPMPVPHETEAELEALEPEGK
jgi:two-component system chemotaxis response regulator CheB